MSEHSRIATAREALVAELLEEIDRLVRRLETVDKDMASHIEQAVREAAGKAFLATRLNLETLIDEQAGKLIDAGRQAGREIGQQLESGAARALAANRALERATRRWIYLTIGLSSVAGAVGGAALFLLWRLGGGAVLIP